VGEVIHTLHQCKESFDYKHGGMKTPKWVENHRIKPRRLQGNVGWWLSVIGYSDRDLVKEKLWYGRLILNAAETARNWKKVIITGANWKV